MQILNQRNIILKKCLALLLVLNCVDLPYVLANESTSQLLPTDYGNNKSTTIEEATIKQAQWEVVSVQNKVQTNSAWYEDQPLSKTDTDEDRPPMLLSEEEFSQEQIAQIQQFADWGNAWLESHPDRSVEDLLATINVSRVDLQSFEDNNRHINNQVMSDSLSLSQERNHSWHLQKPRNRNVDIRDLIIIALYLEQKDRLKESIHLLKQSIEATKLKTRRESKAILMKNNPKRMLEAFITKETKTDLSKTHVLYERSFNSNQEPSQNLGVLSDATLHPFVEKMGIQRQHFIKSTSHQVDKSVEPRTHTPLRKNRPRFSHNPSSGSEKKITRKKIQARFGVQIEEDYEFISSTSPVSTMPPAVR